MESRALLACNVKQAQNKPHAAKADPLTVINS